MDCTAHPACVCGSPAHEPDHPVLSVVAVRKRDVPLFVLRMKVNGMTSRRETERRLRFFAMGCFHVKRDFPLPASSCINVKSGWWLCSIDSISFRPAPRVCPERLTYDALERRADDLRVGSQWMHTALPINDGAQRCNRSGSLQARSRSSPSSNHQSFGHSVPQAFGRSQMIEM